MKTTVTVILQRLNSVLGRLTMIGLYAAVSILALMILLNAYGITARYVFHRGFGEMNEILAYGNIGIVFLALAYCHRQGQHISIDILSSKLRGKPRKYLGLFSLIMSCIGMGILAYFSWWYNIQWYQLDRRSTTILETPLYIPFIMLTIGVTLYFLEVLMTAIREIISGLQEGNLSNVKS